MSGIAKGIGKVFKGVAKVAKVIAPIALIGAAAVATGGAALGAAPALGGAAAAGTAAAAGGAAAAGAGAAAAAGGGFWGGLSGLLSNPTVGALISGAAQGWSQGAQMREEEEQAIRAEERAQASYAGVGDTDAQAWNAPTTPSAPRSGLGTAAGSEPEFQGAMANMAEEPAPQQAAVVDDRAPATDLVNTPSLAFRTAGRPRRPGIDAMPAAAPGPRYQYDPASGRIVHA